ncbi:GMC family oxidoreductase [Plantactinospora sp. CA-294935]|uniref:GMC family oxidoreductase n=1 Tax=Plantactinospora sp. CA-294935 TaxID=3240012 RepID=UPI003D8BFFC1
MTGAGKASRHFDVAVVGGGSAGAVVAARMVTAGASVCLIEAGPDYGPLGAGRWPADLLDPRILPTSHDWDVHGEITTSRARVLGGCSAHNGCWCVRPTPLDAAEWVAGSGGDWTPAEVGAAVARAEAVLAPRRVRADALTPVARAALAGADRLGVAMLGDVNDATAIDGAGLPWVNIHGSVRWNTGFAYLDGLRGLPGLTIEADLPVDRLLFTGARATGVLGHRHGVPVTVAADRVVLTAGAYGTPAVLLRSGVGPADELARHGIPPVQILPGVGANLADHVGSGLTFAASDDLIAATGAFAAEHDFFPSQVLWKARSPHCDPGGWDEFILPIPQYDPTRPGRAGYHVQLQAFCMTPRSRGRVRLRGRDPQTPPEIDPRFLTDPEGHDLAVILDGLERARELAATPELAGLLAAELLPGADATDRDELVEHVEATVRGYWHPTGTAAMLPDADPMSVTGPDGLVRGLDNVHVADASVIPVSPRGNTNLPVVAVAEVIAARLAGAATAAREPSLGLVA